MIRITTISLLAVLLIASCSNKTSETATNNADGPEFLFLDGTTGQLNDFRNKWLFLNFWSISCPPCYREMPDLVKLYQEFQGDGFELIGVAMSYDRPDLVIDTKEKHQLNYPVSLDLNNEINQVFGPVEMIPTTLLLAPDGQVVKKHVGLVTYQQLKTMLLEHRAAYNKGT
jgi:thiol-disulfide isomerase/thioredoxin